jgi:hypothetical protein
LWRILIWTCSCRCFLKFIEVQGLAESTLGDTIREAAKEFDVVVQADKEPDQNRLFGAISTALSAMVCRRWRSSLGMSSELRRIRYFTDWIRDRYHKPSDDLNQPVDKGGGGQVRPVDCEFAVRVADAGGLQ